MKSDLQHPCNVCPLRKNAMRGYLCAANPYEFIDAVLSDTEVPCHKTVDYNNPLWYREMEEARSNVQQCAGQKIFYKNQCKIPKTNKTFIKNLELIERDNSVFTFQSEFLEHHILQNVNDIHENL